MIVGIVAEGPTDVVILEEFLSERFKSGGVSGPLEIRPLQPAVDATSGTFEDGGWTWVRAWCANNPTEHRAVDLFQPLFEGDRPLDILIVQVDGDVVDEYARPYPHIPGTDESRRSRPRADRRGSTGGVAMGWKPKARA